MEKKKFYYNPTTFEIERRAFYDEVEDKDLPFIELTFVSKKKDISLSALSLASSWVFPIPSFVIKCSAGKTDSKFKTHSGICCFFAAKAEISTKNKKASDNVFFIE